MGDNIQSVMVSRRNRPDFRSAVVVMSVSLLLASCVTMTRPPIPFPMGITPPRTIAVLPLDNQTNSVAGALYVREVMHRNLSLKGYVPTPLQAVDQTLANRMGISLGGQIREVDIKEVGTALEVDAVLFGTLTKFGTVLASYSEAEVLFEMYETRTGNKIWERRAYYRDKTELSNPNANSATMTAALLGSLIERGQGKPLRNVVRGMFRDLLDHMPDGAEPIRAGRWVD